MYMVINILYISRAMYINKKIEKITKNQQILHSLFWTNEIVYFSTQNEDDLRCLIRSLYTFSKF